MRALLLLALASCSLTLQSHLESDYRESSEPDCSTSPGLAIADFVIAGADFGIAAVVAGDGNRSDDAKLLFVDGVVEGIIYLASGIAGESWIGDCKRAQKKWSDRQDAAAAAMPVRSNSTTAARRRIEQRGFFCAVSIDAEVSSFCVRDRTACTSARDAVLASVPDLRECEIRQAAWCFGDRCAPIRPICDAQRLRAMGADGTAPDCEETR